MNALANENEAIFTPTELARKLTKAQKRALIAAYNSPDGEAFGLSYGPMNALTQVHHLAHEVFLPRAPGFHIGINKQGRAVAEVLIAKAEGRP